MTSACPVQSGVSINAEGIIPVNEDDVSGIPDIALAIPDFEGQAILRIFSNSTQAEIGCFAALITNGNTFRQKLGVGIALGVFTLVAILSSFATAIHGEDVIEIRKNYAHSVSVMIVFAVWHHIYFSGALSLNWPSVLVSYWSNYAWTGGMIYSEHMQNSINEFIGSNRGNTSQVGAAGTGVDNPDLGGGYDIHAIYAIHKRMVSDAVGGFSYTGQPVKPGLPLPGNFSGFAGTLAQERIPASNAFMTSLLWFLVLVLFIIVSVVAFKLTLEALSTTKMMKSSRLAFFRSHYLRYTVVAILRAAFIGFFMLTFVSMFQLTYLKSPKSIAIACAVFLMVVIGIGTAAGLTCYYKIRKGKYGCERDTLVIEMTTAWKILPWLKLYTRREPPPSEDESYSGSIPWLTVRSATVDKSHHEDEEFIFSFGWLASRYRRTRWWFFAVWLVYEFIRAGFIAGASSQPLAQVFGLLVVDITAFVALIYLRPFQGQRLNSTLMYSLGFSKVATTALSASFDASFQLPRILATVIGVIIIAIQGLLTITVIVTIVIGARKSYVSIRPNRKTMMPRRLPLRERYRRRIHRSHPSQTEPLQQVHSGSNFSVNQVRRIPKVEDEDQEFLQEIRNDASTSKLSILGKKGPEQPMLGMVVASNQSQVSYTALPPAARLHRPNWNSQELVSQRSGGRARAFSNTSTSTSRTIGGESLDRMPEPSHMPASAPSPPRQSGDESRSLRRMGSRPSVSSRTSSRLVLDSRISEEDIPPVPAIKG